MRFCSAIADSYYLVEMDVYRSHLQIRLAERKFETGSIVIPANLLDFKAADNESIHLALENIRTIVTDHNGFYIVLNKSHSAFYFVVYDYGLKSKMITKIAENAIKFLSHKIDIESHQKKHVLNTEFDEKTSLEAVKIFPAMKVTPFGDYLPMRLGVDDNNVFEIVDGLVCNKIEIGKMIRIGIHRVKTRKIEIYFANGDVVKYIMRSEHESSFLSQICGIVNQQFSNPDVRLYGNSLIFLGHLELNKTIIWGLEEVPEFRQKFEREKFEAFIKEQKDENFLNYHFTGSFDNFTIKTFISRFEKLIGKTIKLLPAFKLRTNYEDCLIQLLLSLQNNPQAVSTPAQPVLTSQSSLTLKDMTAGDKIEDLFQRISTIDRKNFEFFRKNLHQVKKIYDDKLKEVLTEDCFGEKLELELIIDRMWSFLSNMIQNGEIVKEISVALNSSVKTDSEVYLKLFALAVEGFLQSDFIRRVSHRELQHRPVPQSVH